MTRYLRPALNRLFFFTDPTSFELMSGLVATLWSLWLVLNPQALTLPEYAALRFLPPLLVIVIMATIGLVQITRFFLKANRHLWLHQMVVGSSMLTWAAMTSSVISAQAGAGIITAYGVLTLGCIWAFLQSGSAGYIGVIVGNPKPR